MKVFGLQTTLLAAAFGLILTPLVAAHPPRAPNSRVQLRSRYSHLP